MTLNATLEILRRIQALRLQEFPATKAIESIAEPARQASVRQPSQITNIVQEIVNSTRSDDSLLQESNAMKALGQFSNLPFTSPRVALRVCPRSTSGWEEEMSASVLLTAERC